MAERERGFTLIELIIVVAIVAIMAMLAYPSYQDSVRKSRRSEAMSGLLQIQLLQEKLRTSCQFYAQGFGTGGCDTTAADTEVDFTGANGDYYNFAVVAGSASGTGYTATATPQGDQAQDSCGTFAINQDGPDPSGAYADDACWGR